MGREIERPYDDEALRDGMQELARQGDPIVSLDPPSHLWIVFEKGLYVGVFPRKDQAERLVEARAKHNPVIHLYVYHAT